MVATNDRMTYGPGRRALCPVCGRSWTPGWWGSVRVAVLEGAQAALAFPGGDGFHRCCSDDWTFRWEGSEG